ncbi:hypothetical protein PULV_a3297 [Pseudoalteromonas ulvae UL12]|nr:hypothetical protein [Pseudoalteromonas ulvae UL12]
MFTIKTTGSINCRSKLMLEPLRVKDFESKLVAKLIKTIERNVAEAGL